MEGSINSLTKLKVHQFSTSSLVHCFPIYNTSPHHKRKSGWLVTTCPWERANAWALQTIRYPHFCNQYHIVFDSLSQMTRYPFISYITTDIYRPLSQISWAYFNKLLPPCTARILTVASTPCFHSGKWDVASAKVLMFQALCITVMYVSLFPEFFKNRLYDDLGWFR